MDGSVPKILILEDDSRRIEAMQRLLASEQPQLSQHIFPTASEVISFYTQHKSEIALIALDHDLEDVYDSSGNQVDPGTGRDVSDFLSSQKASCPLIIHSTNRTAVDGMEFELVESGWQVERIAPYADLEWIQEAWMPAIARGLRSNML